MRVNVSMDYSHLHPVWNYVVVRELPPPKSVGLVKSADVLAERTGFGEVVAVSDEVTQFTPGDIIAYNDLMSCEMPKRRGIIEEPLYAVTQDKIFAKFDKEKITYGTGNEKN